MKKIFVLLLTIALAYVSYAKKVSDDQLARVKAIAAYHVNRLSLPDDFPDATCPENMDIKKIQEKINTKKDNVNLTNFIAQSNPNSQNIDTVYKYYTSTLFDDKIFKSFFEKPNRNKIAFLNSLKSEIASVLKIKEELKAAVEEKIVEPTPNNDSTTTPAQNPPKESSIFLPVLSLILAILALGAAIYLFLELNKLKSYVDEKNDHRKASIIILQKRLTQLDDDLAKNKSQMSDMKRQVTENSDKVNKMQRSSGMSEDIVRSHGVSRGLERGGSIVREFYAGVPPYGSDCFKASDTYSAKTIYKIIAKGDSIGEFEFIDRPEAVAVAQQSKTSFLDPACNVVNDDLVNFSRIVTERKGTVERTDDGWKIIKKADIRLA